MHFMAIDSKFNGRISETAARRIPCARVSRDDPHDPPQLGVLLELLRISLKRRVLDVDLSRQDQNLRLVFRRAPHRTIQVKRHPVWLLSSWIGVFRDVQVVRNCNSAELARRPAKPQLLRSPGLAVDRSSYWPVQHETQQRASEISNLSNESCRTYVMNQSAHRPSQ